MVQAGKAISNAVQDFVQAREKIIRDTIAVKQHSLMTDLQLATIKQMDEDAVNLPPGQFNAEKYLEDFAKKTDSLMSRFEDKQSRLNLEQMTVQVKGQLGLRANKYELESMKAAQKQAKENLFNNSIQNLYQTMQSGADVLEEAPFFFSQAEALKPSLSFSEQQDLEEKKGDYAILTLELRRQQAAQQLLQNNITPDEFLTSIDESQRMLNDFPLTADQRILANEQIEAEKARFIATTTRQDVAFIKENFDGYKQEYIMTGKIDPKFLNKLAKYAPEYPELYTLMLEIDVVTRSRPFYNALARGDVRTMGTELQKARAEADPDLSDGKEFSIRQQRYNKLLAEYGRALKSRNENFAEFYKNDPRVKAIKTQGLSQGSGGMTNYVRYMQALAQEQGLDPNEIKLLTNDDRQFMAERLKRVGRNPQEALRLALDVDNRYGVYADKIFGEIIAKDSDPRLNALRFRKQQGSFDLIWEAATMPKDEFEGLKTMTGIETKDAEAVAAKDLKDYYDSRLAQGDQDIGAAIKADTELVHRLKVKGRSDNEIANMLANNHYDYVTGGKVNLRIPKEKATENLYFRLKNNDFRKTLIEKKFDQIPMLDPSRFTPEELRKQPEYSFLDVEDKMESIADKELAILKDSLLNETRMVTGENGVRFVTPTLQGGTLLDSFLRDKDGKIIEYSWDELENMAIEESRRNIQNIQAR